MADHHTDNNDEQLGELLGSASNQVFPPTPDFAGAVRSRIQPASEVRPTWYTNLWRPMTKRPILAAAASIVLVLITSVSAFTWVPGAIADRLGVSGIEITTSDDWGDLDLTPVANSGLELGEGMSLDEARDVAPFEIRTPAEEVIDPPDNAHVGLLGDIPIVSLTWDPRDGLDEAGRTGVGLLITQFPADLADEPFVTKGVEEPNFDKEVLVNGNRGYWLQGRHTFRFSTGAGDGGTEQVRLAENVLLWEEDGYVFRIEGGRSLTFEDAIAIAESMSEE